MKETSKPTLLIASAFTESRRRWVSRLQETFAVCEVAERRALEQVTANLRPDILVLDLALPQLGGIRGLASIKRLSPPTKILALTETFAENEGIAALKAGAKGYCPRAIDPAHLKKAVNAIRNGEIWVQRKLIAGLVSELMFLAESSGRDGDMAANADLEVERLTDRQRVVADLLSRGACNKEIAARLNIAERTVKAHLTEAYRCFGVSDRLQLALLLKAPLKARAGLYLLAHLLWQSSSWFYGGWTIGAIGV